MIKTEKLNERVLWVDTLKGLCMVAVVLSHAFPPTKWIRLYTPFFLTGFFFASGYTFNMRDSFHDFLIQKIRSLLVPLITLSLINGVVGILFKGVSFKERLLGIIVQQAGGYESLWFFACLFICELLFYIAMRFADKEWQLLIFTHGSAALGFIWIAWGGVSLPWQFDIACVSLMFLSWGLVYRRHERYIDKIFAKKSICGVLLITYVFLCLIYDNDVNVHERRFGIQWLFTLEAFIGLIIIVHVAKKVCNSRILNYIGTHSIIYFAFQGFLLQTIRQMMLRLTIQNNVILCVGSTMLALPILGIVGFIMYTYFPCLLGRPRKSSNKSLDRIKQIDK